MSSRRRSSYSLLDSLKRRAGFLIPGLGRSGGSHGSSAGSVDGVSREEETQRPLPARTLPHPRPSPHAVSDELAVKVRLLHPETWRGRARPGPGQRATLGYRRDRPRAWAAVRVQHGAALRSAPREVAARAASPACVRPLSVASSRIPCRAPGASSSKPPKSANEAAGAPSRSSLASRAVFMAADRQHGCDRSTVTRGASANRYS